MSNMNINNIPETNIPHGTPPDEQGPRRNWRQPKQPNELDKLIKELQKPYEEANYPLAVDPRSASLDTPTDPQSINKENLNTAQQLGRQGGVNRFASSLTGGVNVNEVPVPPAQQLGGQGEVSRLDSLTGGVNVNEVPVPPAEQLGGQGEVSKFNPDQRNAMKVINQILREHPQLKEHIGEFLREDGGIRDPIGASNRLLYLSNQLPPLTQELPEGIGKELLGENGNNNPINNQEAQVPPTQLESISSEKPEKDNVKILYEQGSKHKVNINRLSSKSKVVICTGLGDKEFPTLRVETDRYEGEPMLITPDGIPIGRIKEGDSAIIYRNSGKVYLEVFPPFLNLNMPCHGNDKTSEVLRIIYRKLGLSRIYELPLDHNQAMGISRQSRKSRGGHFGLCFEPNGNLVVERNSRTNEITVREESLMPNNIEIYNGNREGVLKVNSKVAALIRKGNYPKRDDALLFLGQDGSDPEVYNMIVAGLDKTGFEREENEIREDLNASIEVLKKYGIEIGIVFDGVGSREKSGEFAKYASLMFPHLLAENLGKIKSPDLTDDDFKRYLEITLWELNKMAFEQGTSSTVSGMISVNIGGQTRHFVVNAGDSTTTIMDAKNNKPLFTTPENVDPEGSLTSFLGQGDTVFYIVDVTNRVDQAEEPIVIVHTDGLHASKSPKLKKEVNPKARISSIVLERIENLIQAMGNNPDALKKFSNRIDRHMKKARDNSSLIAFRLRTT